MKKHYFMLAVIVALSSLCYAEEQKKNLFSMEHIYQINYPYFSSFENKTDDNSILMIDEKNTAISSTIDINAKPEREVNPLHFSHEEPIFDEHNYIYFDNYRGEYWSDNLFVNLALCFMDLQ